MVNLRSAQLWSWAGQAENSHPEDPASSEKAETTLGSADLTAT